MIKTFQSKIPLSITQSYAICLDAGSKLDHWQLNFADETQGSIEWMVKPALGFSSYVRVYLRQQREEYTLVTVYVNRKYMIIDPFGKCEKMFMQLAREIEKLANTSQ